MAKFRIDSLAELARQLTFTPHETRLDQLAAAEDLLHDIDPSKAYPLEFVVFRVTGYRPRSLSSNLLTGLALQHDLGLLIEQLSESLDLHTQTLSEPVLQIEDVCERFNVTSKTIQRWRRRGLPARRFVFPDGKRRVGFLLSNVERFFNGHQDQVARGMNFSQVSDDEKRQILRRARRLAERCHCCVNEVARRIGRKMNRSPLTILHTVRKHDAEHPQDAVFLHAADPIGDDERVRIIKAHRHGVGVTGLARRLCRPRSAIYRVIIEERIARLSKRKVKFYDDELYHEPDADSVLRDLLKQEQLTAPVRAEDARMPRDLPPYLAELWRVPLLTPARERALFLKFNFHKYQFVTARRRLEPQFVRARDLDELEGHLRRATDVKNQIVRANLRLVVSIARKHLRPNLSLMELVSDGNLTLMRAVEGFDVHKGNRFSTYATLALMKGFARSVPTMLSRSRQSSGGDAVLADVADARPERQAESLVAREEVGQLLSRLDTRERDVIRAHFGLGESVPSTYEEVGARLGISKQRVRQIEQAALKKLRAGLPASK